jgi:hypothetical protein
MNDRTRRPTMAPEDDPSIPVLTERLTLPVPAAGGKAATPSSAADAVVDSMVFPKAAPARPLEPAAPGAAASRTVLPSFELPPTPAAAPAARPVAAVNVPVAARPAAATPPPTAAASAALIAPAAPIAPPVSPAPLPDAAAIRGAVLDDLAARLPREIESLMRKQLAGSIEAAVQAASTDLAARIRNAAAQSLQNLVEQAVKAEIARLRQSPPK